jgi:hypothetical protein
MIYIRKIRIKTINKIIKCYKLKTIEMDLKAPLTALLICLLFNCCDSNTNKKTSDNSKTDTVPKSVLSSSPNLNNKSDQGKIITDSNLEFEKGIYLKIDKIYSGKTFTNKEGKDVFYRILEIPEEENITLFAENISMGEEGGKYQLIKRTRLTDDNSVLPKFGLNSLDSVRFTDSITIEGYFNKEKIKINLSSLKKI